MQMKITPVPDDRQGSVLSFICMRDPCGPPFQSANVVPVYRCMGRCMGGKEVSSSVGRIII